MEKTCSSCKYCAKGCQFYKEAIDCTLKDEVVFYDDYICEHYEEKES